MAKFNLENIIYLDSVKSVFLIGDIIEGRISIGMSIKIEGLPVQINNIESVDGELGDKSVSKVALTISSDKMFYSNLRDRIVLGSILDIN